MRKTITKIAVLSLSFFVLLSSRTALATCSPGANSSLMTQAFMKYLTTLTDKNDRIAIVPFTDLQTVTAEPLLAKGLPFLIYDMFASENENLLHPYVSIALAQTMGVTGSDPAQIKTFAEKSGVRFVVYGSVQKTPPNQIHVIVRVYDQKTGITSSPPAEFNSELNDSFFSLVRESVKTAFSRVEEKIKSANFQDPSLQAFLFYVRGIDLAATYSPTNLELASVWLEKALKENYHRYDDAALAAARVHFMSALIQKLNKNDFSQNMLRGQRFLNFVKSDDDKTQKMKIAKRYVTAHADFISAITALRNSQSELAAKSAAKTLTLVPEDGMAEQILTTSASGGGGPKDFAPINPVCL